MERYTSGVGRERERGDDRDAGETAPLSCGFDVG